MVGRWSFVVSSALLKKVQGRKLKFKTETLDSGLLNY